MDTVESENNVNPIEEAVGSVKSGMPENREQPVGRIGRALAGRGRARRIGVLLAACGICALLIGLVAVPVVLSAVYPDQSLQAQQVGADIQATDLVVNIAYPAWTQADGGARVTVTDESDGSTVQEKEIPFNADSVVDSLLPGDYSVRIQLPIAADGTVLTQPQETDLTVPDDADGGGVVRADVPVSAMPDASVTDDSAAAAASAYARDDAEKASILGRYQAKKAAAAAAAQAAADQAAAQAAAAQAATDQSAVAAAQGSSFAASSAGSGYDGGSSYDGGGSSYSGGSDSGSSGSGYSAPSTQHQPQTVKTATTYYCNTCKAAFSSLDALLAHQEETYEAWEKNEVGVVHGGYTSDTETWTIE